MRRAFTLIELLVVIAIIAILAAILFPVFAQAKAAAKATQSLSNARQVTTSTVMYVADSDDVVPPTATWGDAAAPITVSGYRITPWPWLLGPYAKNYELFTDPLAPAYGTANVRREVYIATQPSYGYNHAALSPYAGGVQQPISATAAGDPAATVMLTSKGRSTEWIHSLVHFTGYINGWYLGVIVDSPLAQSTGAVVSGNWGNPNSSWAVTFKNQAVPGAFTGGVAERSANGTSVTFLDGHAKTMKRNALAAGTNFSMSRPATETALTDESRYLWDLK